MRIIGGSSSRRTLKVPKGFAVRPTPDRVKLALFNSLGERILQARVLELFAGTGALSLECLSRGAALAVCVERSQRHALMIRENQAIASLTPARLEIRTQDVFTVLPQLAAAGRQFDLVLADPPYGEKNVGRRSTSFAQRLLDDLELPRLLSPDGLFILGHTRRDTLEWPVSWQEVNQLKHGDSVMRFFRRVPSCPVQP
jgi:16S rRNA (guanine966-N2)-methyltransferase